MRLTLTNAVLFDYGPPRVRRGELQIDGDTIAAIGDALPRSDAGETIDCRGAVVLPGLVNGHTHLYSALAPGMPPPRHPPRTFLEILERVWWRLDRALDASAIEASGMVGALDALRCGTTTLIDHHASPNCIDGSLDALERGIAAVGPRAVLCYETTDRHGASGAMAGLAENRRYLERCKGCAEGRFAAMVGAHAAFTLSDETLAACADLAGEFATGVHIHVAEDPCDNRICREQYGSPLVDRLVASGIAGPDSAVAQAGILGHGTHLSPTDARILSERVAAVAHNPRSNMNNHVGYAPMADLSKVQLGTDGIGSDMFTECRHAWFKARDAGLDIAPVQVLDMLAHAAQTAGSRLRVRLGVLEPGAAADVVVTDYVPPTPLDSGNAPAHLIFALGAHHVRDVLIAGDWALRDRAPVRIDGPAALRRAVPVAAALWSRMQALDD